MIADLQVLARKEISSQCLHVVLRPSMFWPDAAQIHENESTLREKSRFRHRRHTGAGKRRFLDLIESASSRRCHVFRLFGTSDKIFIPWSAFFCAVSSATGCASNESISEDFRITGRRRGMLKCNTLAVNRPLARLWPTRLPQQEKCVFSSESAVFPRIVTPRHLPLGEGVRQNVHTYRRYRDVISANFIISDMTDTPTQQAATPALARKRARL